MGLSIKLPISIIAAALIQLSNSATQAQSGGIPTAPREFRGVWVATVDNIDWPSQRTLSGIQQQQELIRIIERAKELRMNAIIFQIRPAGDALYQSQLEPWSEFLTGQEGKSPSPAWDPLQVAIEESHRRGMELHAWINPYRASHPSQKTAHGPTHLSRKNPAVVRKYGKYEWFDPGERAVQEHIYNVIMDVVRRYDVDAIHFDDYFYPYKSYAPGVDFPDQETYARFKSAGGTLSKDDWRRENVNVLVEGVNRGIKQLKPHVKFGISPFGIWRPGNPSGIVGMDPYSELYIDGKKWLREGWVDYLSPQLYWKISSSGQSFPKLLDWWIQQNSKNRHVWPGMIPNSLQADEITNQVMETRKRPGSTGHIFFSMKSFKNQSSIASSLQQNLYTTPALVPPSPWIDSTPPSAPVVQLSNGRNSGEVVASWAPSGQERPFLWTLYARIGSNWVFEVLPGGQTSYTFSGGGTGTPNMIAVGAVDRSGNESTKATPQR